jgi:sortase B
MDNKKKIAWNYIIPAVILIGILVFAIVKSLGIYLPQERQENEYKTLKQSVITRDQNENVRYNYADLSARNSDFRAWLHIEGTEIDYPVMQSEEPEFYLRRNFDKEYSRAGSLFIGEGCDLDSESFIIYGHNMSIDTMFGTLDRYADADFALKHREILLSTPESDRTYRVFAAFRTSISNDAFPYYEAVGKIGSEKYTDSVERFRAMSEVDFADAPDYPSQLMILSTCSYHTGNGRFVVVSYRTD